MPNQPRADRSYDRTGETRSPNRHGLGAKTQELSRLLVEKALAGRSDEHWQEFLQIVQASKLSSLANPLDSDLVSFIRQVLD